MAVPMIAVPDEYKAPFEKLKDATSCKDFYKIQSQHQLGEECDRKKVAIWFSQSNSDPKPTCDTELKAVHNDWIPHLDKAIEDINNAAPGLHLYRCDERVGAHVIIYGTKEDDIACTRGNIIDASALICLSDGWNEKKRTSCQQLLHALSFQHEHKRSDGKKYMDYHSDDLQMMPRDDVIGITRFDPFSIMMYCESDQTFTRNASGDEVWKLKEAGKQNDAMSELDKVALNIIFRPCAGPHYSPKKKSSDGLWYCKRKGSTEHHNRPKDKATDGRCGPTSYPNCPACRVLKNPLLEKIWEEDRWQGWSGFVYCGRGFGKQRDSHDGYCGPDNGPPCPQCIVYMYQLPGLPAIQENDTLLPSTHRPQAPDPTFPSPQTPSTSAEIPYEPPKRHYAAIERDALPDEYESFKKIVIDATSCKEFYKIQSKHEPGNEDEIVKVPIWFSQSDSDPKPPCDIKLKAVHNDWIPHLQNAIEDINNAAPGLHLYRCDEKAAAHVIIHGTKEGASAYTEGNIKKDDSVLICLPDTWNGKKHTSCHELLHALSIEHEHNRSDGDRYVNCHSNDIQKKPLDTVVGITIFDPFSIMIYPEGHDTFIRTNADGKSVWRLIEARERNVKLSELVEMSELDKNSNIRKICKIDQMSELDKIGLNIIFRPCVGKNYLPKKASGGLWYCGREGSTEHHNWPANRATDGRCGPTNYPNCPACRVLKNPLLDKIWEEDRWQGWSGFVYCGRGFGKQRDGHDGYCGPDNGPSCPECIVYMYSKNLPGQTNQTER